MSRADGTLVVSSNGHAAAGPPAHGAEVIAALRRRPTNIHLFRGFGTLVAGVVLFLLMLWLAPSVAPEHIVDQPVSTTTVVSATTAPTTPTTAPVVTP